MLAIVDITTVMFEEIDGCFRGSLDLWLYCCEPFDDHIAGLGGVTDQEQVVTVITDMCSTLAHKHSLQFLISHPLIKLTKH